MAKPTFLCIGAQRCGTTRLHRILSAHPEVLMTSSGVDRFEKEIHYFDNLIIQKPLSWYEDHFSATGITGEITPAYSALSDKVVAGISRYLPAVKLIFVIRRPYERIWSQICMMRSGWGHKDDMHAMDFVKLIQIVESPVVALRSDYFRTLRNWNAFFPAHQLLVITFEKLLQQDGLSQVFNHIGVNPCWSPSTTEAGKVLSAIPAEMPRELRWWITLRWIEMIRNMYESGADIQAWIREMEEVESQIPSSFRCKFAMLQCLVHKANRGKWRQANQRDDAVSRALQGRLSNVQC